MHSTANIGTRVAPSRRGEPDHRGAPGAIRVEGLTVSFTDERGRTVQVLDDINFEARPGEFVAVIGPSGSGKTTLLNILSGLERVEIGRVEVDGKPPRPGNPRVGYLFARDALLPWRTALKNVEIGLQLQGWPRKERSQRAAEALKALGLDGFENNWRAQLSQGMRQRVAIARVLATEPSIIFMDEPFSALDAQTRLAVQEQFLAVRERIGATVVLITHDLAEAISLADRVVCFTARPARVKQVVEVDLPRPRSVMHLQEDAAYHRLYASVWRTFEDEVIHGATTAAMGSEA